MDQVNILTREQFDQVIDNLSNSQGIDKNVVYEIYLATSEGIQGLIESNILRGIRNVNPLELIYYCLGEYTYTNINKTPEERQFMAQDERYITSMASVASDKYLSLSMFNHVERKLANRFIPPVSSLNLYLNFMLNILQSYKKNDPKATLITDLLMKSVSISRCILGLVTDGYETEAFASWRTLHECECTLLLLEKYGDPIINRYLIHMQYGIVFKKEDLEDEKGTKSIGNPKKIPTLGHIHNGIWKHDETKHWHECARCHEVFDEHTHIVGSEVHQDLTHSWKLCTICNQKVDVQDLVISGCHHDRLMHFDKLFLDHYKILIHL